MSFSINQQEEILITEVNSEESIPLSSITSDDEKLKEIMDTLFNDEDEESLQILQAGSEQIGRKSLNKSRSNSRNSNQFQVGSDQKPQVFMLKTKKKSLHLQLNDNQQSSEDKKVKIVITPTCNSSEKKNLNKQFLDYGRQQSPKQTVEYQPIQEQFKEEVKEIKNRLGYEYSVQSSRSSRSQNLAPENFLENQQKPRKEFSFMNTRRSAEVDANQKQIQTTQSYDSNDQLFQSLHQLSRKISIQQQFGDLPKQEDFICGCITQQKVEENEEQTDICTIL